MEPKKQSNVRKVSLFRKLCQAFGVVLIVWSFYWSAEALSLTASGELTIAVGLTKVILSLAMLGGTGVLFLYFEPRKTIRAIASSYSLHTLVAQREDTRSFADKINASDDDHEDI